MRIWIVKICQADVKKLSERKVRVQIFFPINIPLDHGATFTSGALGVGENTAILGCARRLAYATKTLCDTGSTVKV